MAIEEILSDKPDVRLDNHEQTIAIILENLRKFGLTQNESKIYVYLGKNGPKKAIDISRQQKIPRTETYHLLSTLQKKGIVTSTFEKPTKFEGLSFEKTISTLITNEQKRIDDLHVLKKELIELWESIPNSKISEEKPNTSRFQILQGKSIILNKLENMTKNSQKEILVIGNEKDLFKLYHSDFFQILKKSKSDVKILTSHSNDKNVLFKGISEAKIKTFPKESNKNQFFIITDSNEIILFLNDGLDEGSDVTSVWTDSQIFVNSFKTLFELTWIKQNSLNLTDDLSIERLENDYQHGLKEIEQEKAILQVLNKKISNLKYKN